MNTFEKGWSKFKERILTNEKVDNEYLEPHQVRKRDHARERLEYWLNEPKSFKSVRMIVRFSDYLENKEYAS